MAGHRRQQRVAMIGQCTACAVLSDFVQHIAGQAPGVSLGQRQRHCTHGQFGGRGERHFQSQLLERLAMLFGGGQLDRIGGEHVRDQQLLARHPLPIQRPLEPLVDDPFVGRVHVHQHQSVPVLRQHVDIGQLRDRVAERRAAVGLDRGGGGGRGVRRRHLEVSAGRLRDPQRALRPGIAAALRRRRIARRENVRCGPGRAGLANGGLVRTDIRSVLAGVQLAALESV